MTYELQILIGIILLALLLNGVFAAFGLAALYHQMKRIADALQKEPQ